jgi:hypothetical protein
MALTGWPTEPSWPAGDVIGALDGASRLLSHVSGEMGRRVVVDPGRLLCARVAARAPDRLPVRGGTRSLGGSCRLLPASDSWVAVNLARPDDWSLLPALTGGRVPPATATGGAPWKWLEIEVASRTAHEFVSAAQALGLPASVLGASAADDPCVVERLGASRRYAGQPVTVVDFSALWAGPLCAHLLGRAGAQVVTVESRHRPDGARVGDPQFFAALHEGHRRAVIDFSSPAGRRQIGELVATADVVLEASRPRALAGLALDPPAFLTGGEGRTWVSITGHGRRGPSSHRVAFGDDAAVAGGLVGHDRRGRPVFCADAAADPVAGIVAAVAATASIVAGGGHLVECSMAGAAGWVARGRGCPGHHRVEGRGDRWVADCDRVGAEAVVAEPWNTGSRSLSMGTR